MRSPLLVLAAWGPLLSGAAPLPGGEPTTENEAAELGRCAAHAPGCGTSGVTLIQTRNRITTLEASDLAVEEDIVDIEKADDMAPRAVAAAAAGGLGVSAKSGNRVGDEWCSAEEPAPHWNLTSGTCSNSTDLKVLTYNLFWWNLYNRRGGNGGSASRLIKDNGPFDIMGFQECDDPWRVLNEAGLGSYGVIFGRHATAIAYNKNKWKVLGSGVQEVAEDRPEQHWGRREVDWARLEDKGSGKVVFVVNHHGPLPINTGGICGCEATAYNILKVIGTNAWQNDFKLLLGDLNADENSVTQSMLLSKMHRIASHWVDGIFASCPIGRAENLGNGGSDHDAIKAVFKI